MLQMLLVLTTTLAHFVVKLLWFLYPDRDPRGSREENPKANFPKMLVYGTFFCPLLRPAELHHNPKIASEVGR